MFFSNGPRYPWLTIVAGAALLVFGLVEGHTLGIVIGAVAVVIGACRCYSALRQGRGFISGRPGDGGVTGNRGGAANDSGALR
jgi:hypothetical protein